MDDMNFNWEDILRTAVVNLMKLCFYIRESDPRNLEETFHHAALGDVRLQRDSAGGDPICFAADSAHFTACVTDTILSVRIPSGETVIEFISWNSLSSAEGFNKKQLRFYHKDSPDFKPEYTYSSRPFGIQEGIDDRTVYLSGGTAFHDTENRKNYLLKLAELCGRAEHPRTIWEHQEACKAANFVPEIHLNQLHYNILQQINRVIDLTVEHHYESLDEKMIKDDADNTEEIVFADDFGESDMRTLYVEPDVLIDILYNGVTKLIVKMYAISVFTSVGDILTVESARLKTENPVRIQITDLEHKSNTVVIGFVRCAGIA
jgi:hypothetical protein